MIWTRKALGAAAAAALLMAAGAAHAQDAPADIVEEEPAEVAEEGVEAAEEAEEAAEEGESAEEEREDSDPWSVSGTVSMSMGQGTFVQVDNNSQWADHVGEAPGAFNRVSMGVRVNPSYRWNDFNFGAEIGVSQNLSAGAGPGVVRPYETRLGDLGLSAGWRGHTFEQIGVSVRPSFRMSLPTSARSRATTLYAGTSLGLGFSKTFFGKLSLSYSISGSRSFHQYTSPVMNIDTIGEENAIFRADGAESVEAGRFAIDGVNGQWGLSNSLSAGFTLPGDLSASLSYSLRTGWSYNVIEDDEFSHPEIGCNGRCMGQVTTGSIGLRYRLNETLSLGGGLATRQSPRTSDQQSFNFPFWNFHGAARNASSISMSLTGSY